MSADRPEDSSPAPPAPPSEPVTAPEIRIEPRPNRPRADHSPPPRLSIAHLYLWVTCCAVDLAIVRRMMGDADPGVIGLAIVSLHAMIYGAAWAGLAIFIARRVRRVPWPIEPGEWLLAALGVRMAVEAILAGPLRRMFAAPQAIVAVATAIMLLLPALTRLPTRWRIVFYLLLALQCIPLVVLAGALPLQNRTDPWADWFFRLPWLAAVVTLATLAVATYCDHAVKVPRTWLHWLGLVLWLLVLGIAPLVAWWR